MRTSLYDSIEMITAREKAITLLHNGFNPLLAYKIINYAFPHCASFSDITELQAQLLSGAITILCESPQPPNQSTF